MERPGPLSPVWEKFAPPPTSHFCIPICVMLHILLQSSVTPSSCRPTPRLTHPPVAFTSYHIHHHLPIKKTRSRASLKTRRTRQVNAVARSAPRRTGEEDGERRGGADAERGTAALRHLGCSQSGKVAPRDAPVTQHTRQSTKQTRRPATYFVPPSQFTQIRAAVTGVNVQEDAGE